MKPNAKLWAAIKQRGLNQRQFSRLVKDHESVVSRIITGQWRIDEERKFRYARVLRGKPEDLFPEEWGGNPPQRQETWLTKQRGRAR
jgi:transcriptional regulator with XRE-family HTH domain